MDIQGEYKIGVPREQVWDALNDADTLKQCIPGCTEMAKTSDTEYQAKVIAAIGPVKATFKTKMQVSNLNPPESYTLTGDSKGGAAGFGRGSADIRLLEEAGTTTLHYEADFKVGGKLAQVGSRLVVGVTRKIADDFFGTFSSLLDAEAEKVVTERDRELAARNARRNTIMMTVGVVIAVAVAAWYWLR